MTLQPIAFRFWQDSRVKRVSVRTIWQKGFGDFLTGFYQGFPGARILPWASAAHVNPELFDVPIPDSLEECALFQVFAVCHIPHSSDPMGWR